MSVWRCRKCGHLADELWESVCPGCGGFYRALKIGVDTFEQKGLLTLGSTPKSASENHISTGDAAYDWVTEGGLIAGRVHLLGGFAGVGKTRKLLAIADYIGKTQGKVIYASGEESAVSVNSYATDLGLLNNRVFILGNQSTVEGVLELAKKLNVFLIIFDSAQEFTTNSALGSAGSQPQCKAVGKVVKEYCDTTKTCSIIINQMTGDGTLRGGTELEHGVDCVNVLAFPKEDDEQAPGFEEDGFRCLYNHGKNRGGIANRRAYYKMNDAGVLEHVQARSKLTEFPKKLKRA